MRKKVGLALGGGGAKGFAHIGVLKELERNSIKVDFISGVSVGAVIAAMYACGVSTAEMERISLSTKWTKLVEFIPPGEGFVSPKKLLKTLIKYTKNKSFSQTMIPLRVAAADIDTGENVVFREGNIAKAVLASGAIAGVFEPVRIGGRRLVDGAIINPLPVDEVRAMGANVVIAVDLGIELKEEYGYSDSESEFVKNVKRQFVYAETKVLKNILKLKRFSFFPGPLCRIKNWIVDHFVEPSKVYSFLINQRTGSSVPELLSIYSKSVSIAKCELAKEKKRRADVVIHPAFVGIKMFEFDKGALGIKEGERAARAAIPRIKRLLK